MTDQEKREKVIKGLELCTKKGFDCGTSKECPFNPCSSDCIDDLLKAALTLLKAQEPRVMTLDEFNAHWKTPPQERKPIWEEWKVDNGKGKWKLYGRATGGYGDMWRCWTSRPTDEQRRETPWQVCM